MSRLLWLLGHARDQSGWRDDDVGLGADAGLVPAMAVIFTRRCRRALAAGVLHGYQEVGETLPGLRGRLREADQVRARPGLPLPLEIRYDDYTVDIPENRMLRTAAVRLLSLSGVPPQVRMALTRFDRPLAEATLITPGTHQPGIALTRLNRRYAPALHLAHLVLERTSVERGPGAASASGFLFDMNVVYEDWLTQALTTALELRGGRVERQQQLDLDDDRDVKMRTDVTWWLGADCLAVVDAKYKRLLSTGPLADDLYQVLAYCTALGIRSGHLVYAAGGPPRTHVVRNVGVRIQTHVVPLVAAPERILAAVDGVAAEIAMSAGRSAEGR